MGICSISTSYSDDERLIPVQVTMGNTTDVFDLMTNMTISTNIYSSPIELNPMTSQKIPIQCTLNVEAVQSKRNTPIDIVILIDHSGSMGGEKIRLVKEAAEHLIGYLTPQDRVALVRFDSRAQRMTPLQRMTDQNKRTAIRAIEALEPEGGTHIGNGIEVALEIIHKRRDVNPVTSIFLLSDGEDSEGVEMTRNLLARYKFNDIFTINTFGFGEDHDPILMSEIAHMKDGSYYHIEMLDRIDECFVDCLGGLVSVVADNVHVSIKPETSEVFPSLKVSKAYGIDDNSWTHPDGIMYSTVVSHLHSGRDKNFMLEFEIPSTNLMIPTGMAAVKIATVHVTVQGLNLRMGQPQTITKQADLVVNVVNFGLGTQQVIDDDVMFNYYRVKGGDLIKQAKITADAGQYSQAKNMLSGVIEEMKGKNNTEGNEDFLSLIKDFEALLQYLDSNRYRLGGQHHLIQHHRNHMDERSNLQSNVKYGNQVQANMVATAAQRKRGY